LIYENVACTFVLFFNYKNLQKFYIEKKVKILTFK